MEYLYKKAGIFLKMEYRNFGLYECLTLDITKTALYNYLEFEVNERVNAYGASFKN